MKLGVRTKLLLLSVALIVVSLLSADLFLARPLDRLLTDRTREDLVVRAELAEREVTALAERGTSADDSAWERLAWELGKLSQARVTLVGIDGQVLGDSGLVGDTLPRMENHRERPEVIGALASGQGSAVRRSATLGQRMLYVAVPFHRAGRTLGVVRLALPLSQVDQAVGQLRKALGVASLLALAFAVMLSLVAAHWSSRTLRQLSKAAERMVGGNLAARTQAQGHDEIASLGQSLDHMAHNLGMALDALGRERDLLEGILDGMQEGVLVVAPDGSIVHVNPAIRTMLLLGADAVGQPLPSTLQDADLVAMLEAARSAPAPLFREIELGGLKPRRLLTRVSALAGSPGHLLAVLVDVTDLRRLESLRRDFVANASHELRTPITALRTAAETLAGALADPEEARGFVEIIERNAERLQYLVEDLLDLSRIESREFRLKPEALQLGTFLPGVVGLFRGRAEAKGIALGMNVDRDLTVQADRRALEQALGNLLDNAMKYCPGGTPVTLRASAQGERVRLAVEDSGPGIEARHLPRLFERFYRVDSGRSRELGGTGLGLAIVKHLVEAMGGQVGVDSAPGEGSTFWMTLPKE